MWDVFSAGFDHVPPFAGPYVRNAEIFWARDISVSDMHLWCDRAVPLCKVLTLSPRLFGRWEEGLNH